jgi:PhnB protein
MQASVHLAFNGQCDAAFKFYEKCLGAKPLMKMTYGESPMGAKMPPEMANRIAHAALAVGDTKITGADTPPENYKQAQGTSILLDVTSVAEAERVFAALSEKAKINMPIAETFWAQRFGMLVDQFGTSWMINCGKPM